MNEEIGWALLAGLLAGFCYGAVFGMWLIRRLRAQWRRG